MIRALVQEARNAMVALVAAAVAGLGAWAIANWAGQQMLAHLGSR